MKGTLASQRKEKLKQSRVESLPSDLHSIGVEVRELGALLPLRPQIVDSLLLLLDLLLEIPQLEGQVVSRWE